MSIPIKVLAGIVGMGTASAGIYFALPSYKFFEKPKELSVGERLKESGYFILNLDRLDDISHASEWQSVKTAYSGEAIDSLRFSEINKDDETTINGIKDSCAYLLSSNSDDSSDLEKARRWCVVPVTVSSRITGTLSLLNTEGDDDSNIWQSKLTEYENATSKIPKMPITFTSTSDASRKIADLKNRCKEVSAFWTFNRDFETLVSYARDWCSKDN